MIPTFISTEKAKQDKLFYVVGTVVVYRESDGRCLILKRSEREIAHPGRYALPGGKLEHKDLPIDKPSVVNGEVLDYDDAIEQLMVRETKEESGIDIDPHFKFITSKAFVRPDNVPVMLLKFAAKYVGGEVVIQEGDFTDFAWVNGEEVDTYPCVDGIPDEVRAAIALFKD